MRSASRPAGPDGILESIRQYGTERLRAAGELDEARAGHLRWCLELDVAPGRADFRARFDRVADDLRAALSWAAEREPVRGDVYLLARRLAGLAYARTLVGEAQNRYAQAAALAQEPAAAALMLREAAAAAGCRMRGDDMFRLHLAAAEAARRAGDDAGVAVSLSTAATCAYRFSGKFERLPSHEEAVRLVDEARSLAGADPRARAAVALAEAGVLADAFGSAQGPVENDVADTLARSEHAVAVADRCGEVLAQSAETGRRESGGGGDRVACAGADGGEPGAGAGDGGGVRGSRVPISGRAVAGAGSPLGFRHG